MGDSGMETLFEKLREIDHAPLAIYGMGKNAERLLRSDLRKAIRFVIARDHIGEVFEGYEVKALEEVLPVCKTIVIAASPKVTRIIYERIRDSVGDGRYVFDMQGIQLNDPHSFEKNPYWKQTQARLISAIDVHDVISFDFFDTLFMRRTLLPADVFRVMGRQLEKELPEADFYSWRTQAEQEAVKRYGYPTLLEIYDVMAEQHDLTRGRTDELRRLELQTEELTICPRKTMVAAFLYACRNHKEVFITSDTYFPSAFLARLLQKVGAAGSYTILASCECRANKADGTLYEVLKKRAEHSRILHIGDNPRIDRCMAEKHQLDAYPILSAYDLLQASSCGFVCDHLQNLDDRITLGNILADLLNDPFSLSVSKGRWIFRDAGSIAAMCYTPVLQAYLSFILRQVRGQKNSRVFFVSRDGYFLKELYDGLRKQDPDLPEAIYFYTSREAITKAVCQSEQDVDVLLSDLSKFPKNDLKDLLEQRFHVRFQEIPDITVEDAYAAYGASCIREWVMLRKEEIFLKAGAERERYRAYLERIALMEDPEEKVFLVDLCTRGTVAYGLHRMLGRSVHLIALLGAFLPNAYIEDPKDFSLYLGTTSQMEKPINIAILEMLLASGDGQVSGFDRQGDPEFSPRTEYDRDLLKEVQGCWKDVLCSLWMMHLKWWGLNPSADFVVAMMETIQYHRSDVKKEVFQHFSFTNPLSKTRETNVLENVRC